MLAALKGVSVLIEWATRGRLIRPAAVIGANELADARRDPRVRRFVAEADAYGAEHNVGHPRPPGGHIEP